MCRSRRWTLPPAAAAFRAYIRLRSVDPALNCDRSYTLTWKPALLGGGALVRCWGRTGGAERIRADAYPDRTAAQAHVEALLRHGYRIVAWQ